MRSTFDVLKDISKDWNNMNNSQKTVLASTLAGKTRFDVLSATMNRFDDAISATTTALSSQNSAEEENAKYMTSIEAKITSLKAAWQELVLGKGGLEDFAKAIIPIGTNVLNLTKDLGGLPTILMAIGSAIALVKGDSILSAAKNIVTLMDSFQGLSVAYKEGAVTIALANSTMEASIPIIGLVAVAITGLVALVNGLNSAHQQAIEKQKNFISSNEKAIESLTDAKKQLSDESITREQLNSIISSNIDSYSGELDSIKNLNDARQKGIDLLDQEIKKKAEKTVDTGLTTYESASKENQTYSGSKSLVNSYNSLNADYGAVYDFTGVQSAYNKLSDTSGIQASIKALKDYKTALISARPTNEDSQAYADYTKAINQTETAIGTLQDKYDSNKTLIDNFNSALSASGQVYDDSTHKVRDMTEAEKETADWTQRIKQYTEENTTTNVQAEQSVDDLADAYGVEKDAIEALVSKYGLSNEEAAKFASINQGLSDVTDSANDSINGIQEALSAAQDALEEYSKKGKITLDTFQSLVSLSPEYLSALSDENGQLEINQKTLGNLVEQLKVDAIRKLQSAAAADVLAYANGDVGSMSQTAQDAVSALGKNIETTGNQTTTASQQVAGFAAAVASMPGVGNKTNSSGAQAIISAYQKIASQISDIKVDTTAAGNTAEKSTKKAKSATDKLTDALEKEKDAIEANKDALELQKDALDKTKDKYSKAISYINKQFEKQKDVINDTKDATLNAIDAQIDALNKQKDAFTTNIKAQISALEEEKSERESYWDAQIDALKRANEEQEKNIKLEQLQEALAQAKASKVMIYQNGQFQYGQNESAVSEAEQNLSDYQSELDYENKLQNLEDLKQAEMDSYDQRISALQDYEAEVEQSYDDQISALQDYRDQQEALFEQQLQDLQDKQDSFQEMIDATEEQEEYLAAVELKATSDEKANWDTRLANLQAFVSSYNSILSQLASVEGAISATEVKSKAVSAKISKAKASKKATGDASVKSDTIALIDDDPKNAELVIGSKLNGVPMNLSKGDGVVNAKSTRTLAGLLNTLGSSMGMNGQTIGTSTVNTSNASSQNISIANITLPSVTNAQSFVDELKGFSANMAQYAYSNG